MENGQNNRITDCVFALLAIFQILVVGLYSHSRQKFKYESTQHPEAVLCLNPASEDVCIVPTLFRFLAVGIERGSPAET
jgi:hypothetical protein